MVFRERERERERETFGFVSLKLLVYIDKGNFMLELSGSIGHCLANLTFT